MEKRTLEAWGNAWENNRTGWHLDHANTYVYNVILLVHNMYLNLCLYFIFIINSTLGPIVGMMIRSM